MLSPKTVEKIMKTRAMKEFVVFVNKEVNNLNTLKDIKNEDPVLVAIEVKARKLAYDKLKDILEPLVNNQRVDTFNNQEFIT